MIQFPNPILVDPDSLVTDYEKSALKKLQDYTPAVKNIFGDQKGHDTVGAVAVDNDGNFAWERILLDYFERPSSRILQPFLIVEKHPNSKKDN